MAASSPTRLNYVNPYTPIADKFTSGLDSIITVLDPLYPDPTISSLVDSVYTYVITTYAQTPDPASEQNIKSSIYAIINGYLNYQLAYSPEQMAFIHQLIGGTLACGNPEDIQWHILDIEQQVAQSGLSVVEQAPLLYATAVGSAGYEYWAKKVSTPGLWNNYMTSFTPPIVKFPYWVASAMQGVLIAINLLNAVDKGSETTLQDTFKLQGMQAQTALYGALTVNAGKVVFNWQQEIVVNTNPQFITRKPDVVVPYVRYVINIRFVWGTYMGNDSGCKPSYGWCGIDISFFSANDDSSNGTAEIIDGKLHLHLKTADVPQKYTQQLATGVIPVSRDIQLANDICCKLGIPSYTVRAGNYNFTKCCEGYHFIF